MQITSRMQDTYNVRCVLTQYRKNVWAVGIGESSLTCTTTTVAMAERRACRTDTLWRTTTVDDRRDICGISARTVERGGTCYGRITDWQDRFMYIYFGRAADLAYILCKRPVNEEKSVRPNMHDWKNPREMITECYFRFKTVYRLRYRVEHIPRRWPTDERACKTTRSTRTISYYRDGGERVPLYIVPLAIRQ